MYASVHGRDLTGTVRCLHLHTELLQTPQRPLQMGTGVLFWQLKCYQQRHLGDVIFRNGEQLPKEPCPVFLRFSGNRGMHGKFSIF